MHNSNDKNINVNIHLGGLDKIIELFFLNNLKLNKIMASIQELNQTVSDLQVSIDAKQQQIADAIAAFEQTIADLEAQIGSGGGATAEELQAVVDNLLSAKADLEATPTV